MNNRPRAKPYRLALIGMLAAAALAVGAYAAQSSDEPGALVGVGVEVERPNVVLIVTDDQRLTLNRQVMPKATKRLVKKGTSFRNAIVTTPLCCPSRATILTGQYAHNHGVVSNRAGYRELVEKKNVLPEWLRRAGYRTAHIGKFLNGYTGTRVAPGWDEWYTLLSPRRYYDYDLSINGAVKHYGTRERDHLTRVLNRKAVAVIRRNAGRAAPFYIQLDHFAPHMVAVRNRTKRCHKSVPDPRDTDLFLTERLPKPSSYNEADLSDKPSFLQSLRSLTVKERASVKRRFRCRLASLRGVDRGVKKIVKTLEEVGELEQTVIILMSDNGYFHGEHRIKLNKTLPYEEALRVPIAVRAPTKYTDGGQGIPSTDAPVANLDIAPTILEWADAEPCRAPGECRTMDGRSLVGLLSGGEETWPAERALVIEYGDGEDRDSILGVCGYQGLRVEKRVYVEYTSIEGTSGRCQPSVERELYDLKDDPYQLANLFPPAPGTPEEQAAADLEARLAILHDCAGIAGRDPDPPGRHGHCE